LRAYLSLARLRRSPVVAAVTGRRTHARAGRVAEGRRRGFAALEGASRRRRRGGGGVWRARWYRRRRRRSARTTARRCARGIAARPLAVFTRVRGGNSNQYDHHLFTQEALIRRRRRAWARG
jgi:hypothetical protein